MNPHSSYNIAPLPFHILSISPLYFPQFRNSFCILCFQPMAMENTEPEFFLPSNFLTDDMFNETESSDEENPKASVVLGSSPQSTLSGFGSLSFSSNESPDAPSTPFVTPSKDPLDLLNAAVGQVERLALEKDYYRRRMAILRRQELLRQQLQAARFFELKRQQLIRMQQQQYANAVWENKRRCNTISDESLSLSEWPPLQKQNPKKVVNGSGMTAVFLNSGRRQSTGTGVFLPRTASAHCSEPKRKPGCSTALIPAKVVQALNLNVESMGFDGRISGRYIASDDGLENYCQLKRNYNHAAVAPASSPEILKLPQEWTY